MTTAECVRYFLYCEIFFYEYNPSSGSGQRMHPVLGKLRHGRQGSGALRKSIAATERKVLAYPLPHALPGLPRAEENGLAQRPDVLPPQMRPLRQADYLHLPGEHTVPRVPSE